MAERALACVRLLGESAFGVAMAAAVFAGLTNLVAGGAGAPLAKREARQIRFTKLVLDTETQWKQRDAKPLPPKTEVGLPTQSHERPWIPAPGGRGEGKRILALVSWDRPSGDRVGGIRIDVGGADTDLIPLVRIPPEYPANARGDGSVLVQFDISAQGTVENARVVEASPRGMFEKAALQAIVRWRYRPAVQDGRAVARRGVQVRLRFELEKA